ncbi:MAG: hypothetical protein WA887_08660 [Carnobacterium jeotgali]|uniref:hypothetical protein n=1 Tax=Carnobacterium jeotgali TaxID=545534 RepID=UPI000493500C|nr:hypothetical protein [Carnobacterium jeotgali]
MEKLKIQFQRFMVGRYGVDKFSTYLLYGGLAIVLFFNLLNWSIGGLLGWAAIILGYYRTFSRNRTKRYQENQKFLTFKRRIDNQWKKQRKKFQERKVYKYYACPNCHKKLRVPRNKGKITITCPHCREKFIKKT